jgi:hydroxymethylpyrimidine pyrophosphatase-like HAD family hydrolase
MLEKKEKITHIICDLDDTLSSRRAQMREEVLLMENRGDA